MSRQLMIAEHAGFCFGVRRAVDVAEGYARDGTPCVTLGPLIHNPQVVASLAAQGIRAIDAVEECPKDTTVIIRSHGVGKDTLSALARRDIKVEDATCPFVMRIHDIVKQASLSGIPVLVVGESGHPEVQGTLGWTEGLGRAVLSQEDVEALPDMDSALVVAQTTIEKEKYDEICGYLQKKIKHLDIQQTICPATTARQEAAAQIAAQVDVMLVVGGRNSSNTRKLFSLSRSLCPRTYLIENAGEMNEISIGPHDRIGITAGASTSDCIFKEVVARMNDIERQEQAIEATAPAQEPQETTESTSEADFMADVEKTLVQIRPGQTIVGTVVQITEDEVCVNVGYKADGLVKKADLSSTDVKIGDEIEVEVVKVNDGEGNVLLSQRNIVNRKQWDDIVAKSESGEFVVATGKEAVKGGLIANVAGIRAFIPASQLSQRYVEKIEDFVGKQMKLKIIEVDKAKKRIVASRKAVLIAEEAEKKKEVWSKLAPGTIVKGIVRRLTDFGAFVDVGGVDGLVHVTDLSWGRVRHPSEVVAVGQEIDVKILSMDAERERISLSYKQTQPRPWDLAGEKYIVGSIVEGKVVRITTFGAFVELEPGLDGLVHISQCALTRIAKVEDAVKVGNIVRVKILDVNTEARRISLSIRAVLEDEAFDGLPEGELADEFAIVSADTADVPDMADAPEAPDVSETTDVPETADTQM